jgi:hypothetical protein
VTSGSFQSFPLDQITINREGRQRREIKDVEVLADSLSRLGLVNPVTITRDGTLVAGERRTTAARSLGWTHISVQFVDDLSPTALHAIELEENIKRVDLPWQDQVRALEAYNAMMVEADPSWTNGKTAEALGITIGEISSKLAVAKEMKKDPTLAAAPKYSVARGRVERSTQRQKVEVLEQLRTVRPTTPLINADFNTWAGSYAGPAFNFIHCDFPYGIDASEFNQGGAAAHGGYEDSPEVYFTLLNTLGQFIADGHVDPDAHLMFWFSMKWHRETVDVLTSQGWAVDPFPLIWYKSDNAGILPDPKRGPRRVYETALHCTLGERFIVSPVANTCACGTVRERHMSEKPEAMLRHFFRMYVDSSTILLDPTAGSGSALRAARTLTPGHMVGLERDPEFYSRAVEAYNAG